MPKFYLEDLIKFYQENYKEDVRFSMENMGDAVVLVPIRGKIKFDQTDTANTEGLFPVHIQACHTDLNRNGSSISQSVMEKALPSFLNRPILGFIHKVKDADGVEQYEFYSHNMHEDGDELVYDEIPVGVIPESCNIKLSYDKDKKKTYVEVDGLIYEEYTKAAEILSRKEECSVSVELSIREMSYNAKDKFLSIDDFYFMGVTILGVNDDGEAINPGMAGANVKVSSFADKNELQEYAELLKRVSALESRIATLNGKEDSETLKKKEFENAVNAADENQTVNGAPESFDEGENKDAGTETSDGGEEADPETKPETDEATEEEADNSESGADGSSADEGADDGDSGDSSDGGDSANYSYTVEHNGVKREFSISMNDKIVALSDLVNKVYSNDECWYYVIAYDKYLVMTDSWANKSYKQSYREDDGNYTLLGDREEVFVEYVTKAEREELDNMREDYPAVRDELNRYKSAEEYADKMTVFDDASYANYLEHDLFKELMNKENVSKFSKEELIEKADAALGRIVKETGSFAASSQSAKPVGMFRTPNTMSQVSNGNSRYGTIFNKDEK